MCWSAGLVVIRQRYRLRMPPPDELLDRCVGPFYLKMMRINAAEHGLSLAPDISRVAPSVAPEDVIALLRDHWRPRVMGAWLSVRYEGAEVRRAVLHALETSLGSLDAPPLAVAAVVLGGPDAAPSLEKYFAADEANAWGASGFVAAAGAHIRECLGADLLLRRPEPRDIEDFHSLMRVAQRLRAL